MNAFILRFAGVWRFFCPLPRSGLSIVNRKLKDQDYARKALVSAGCSRHFYDIGSGRLGGSFSGKLFQ
jgi:hypothetical protein